MPTVRLLLRSWFCVAIALGTFSRAEEKNGLQVSVSKKTLDRADTRGNYYTYDRIDRTQGLKVTIKNTTFRAMPEGEIDWTIIVRRYSYTTPEGFTGTDKLPALKPAETIELVIGSAQITGWRDWYDQARDKMEHQLVIRHGDKEMVRLSSTAGFDALAKRTTLKKASSAPPPTGVPATTRPKTAAASAPERSPAPVPPPARTLPPAAAAPRATPAPASTVPPAAPADSFFGIPTKPPAATPAPKSKDRSP